MHTYTVFWWQYESWFDGYVDHDEDIQANNEEEAIQKIKSKYRRGKNFTATKHAS